MKFISLFLIATCAIVQNSFAHVNCEYGLILKDSFVGNETSKWFSIAAKEKDCLSVSVKNLKTYQTEMKVGRGGRATTFMVKPVKVIVQIPVNDTNKIDQLNDQLETLPQKDMCLSPTQQFIEKEVGGLFGFGTSTVYEAVIQKKTGC